MILAGWNVHAIAVCQSSSNVFHQEYVASESTTAAVELSFLFKRLQLPYAILARPELIGDSGICTNRSCSRKQLALRKMLQQSHKDLSHSYVTCQEAHMDFRVQGRWH